MNTDFKNYDEILKMVEEIKISKSFLKDEITDENEMLVLMYKIFGNNFDNNLTFNYFRIYMIDSYLILDYETLDINKRKAVKNLVFVKEYNPILKVDYYSNINNGTKYVEESYSTYLENSNKLSRRLESKTLQNGSFIKHDLNLLNKNLEKDNYSVHRYELYYSNCEVVAVKNKSNMYLKQEPRFTQIINNINSKEELISRDISDKINYILGIDDTKIYTIKRKKRNT